MKTMTSSRPITGPAAWVVIVLLAGFALALVTPSLPIPLMFAMLAGVIYVVVFLSRPDLGLMIVLLVRASTDLSARLASPVFIERNWIAILPNIGLILTLIVGGGLFILRRSLPFISLPGGRVLTLLLLTGLVGMLRSDSVILSFNDWLPAVSSLIVYALAAYLFRSAKRVQKVIDVFAVSFILPALFGFSQLISGAGIFLPDEGVSRIFGTFVHPNSFGLYLVVMFSVFLTAAISQRGKRKVVAWMIVGTSAILLAGTFARVAWVGAAIVVVVVGTLRSRALLLLVPAVALLAFVLVPSLGARLVDPFGAGGSFADRVDLWRGTLEQWQATTAEGGRLVTTMNWLAGLGPGSVERLTLTVRDRPFAAHNDYLRVLVEYGVFGLVLYVILVVVLIRMGFHAWKQSRSELSRAIALSFLALAIADPIMSITDIVFAQTANQVYFWTLAGLAVASKGARDVANGRIDASGKTILGSKGAA